MTDVPKGDKMDLSQAVARACEEGSRLDALTYIAVWESERIIAQAREFDRTGIRTGANEGGWDTCFRQCFREVMEEWEARLEQKVSCRDRQEEPGGEVTDKKEAEFQLVPLDESMLISTPSPSGLTLNISPKEYRILNFHSGPEGAEKCPECSIHGVTEASLISTFKGEPAEKRIGRKCHWCGWRGPCIGSH